MKVHVLVSALALLSIASSAARAGTFQVTKESDTADGVCDADCSLREAILAANAAPGFDTIRVPVGTFALSIAGRREDAARTGDMDITGDTALIGAGAASTVISGRSLDRVFHIAAGATVTLQDMTVRDGGGESFLDDGAGILNDGALTVVGALITRNMAGEGAGRGAGIFNGGSLTMRGNTVLLNSGDFPGGGIYNAGTTEVLGCAVLSNSSLFAGGGIYNDGEMVITASTIVANGVENDGGGIANSGTLRIVNATIADNGTATTSGGHLGGGIANSGTVEMANTILVRNFAGGGNDCSGEITSLGGNIVSDLSRCGIVLIDGDLQGDAGIGMFVAEADVPGRGRLPLLTTSRAVDSANGAACPPLDQLGEPRRDGDGDGIAQCDRGAVEFQPDCDFAVTLEAGAAGTSSSGLWRPSDAPAYHGSGSLWSRLTLGQQRPSFVFQAALPSGYYEVFEWHTDWSTRARHVPHEFQTSAKGEGIYVDQNVNGGRWNSLGTFPFFAASAATYPARLTIFAEDPVGSTNADAIRFVCRSRRAPTAHVVSISPKTVLQGEEVCFEGSGEGPLDIVAYDWQWSTGAPGEYGYLDALPAFCRRDLPPGRLIISLRVQDAAGVWSDFARGIVTVNAVACDTEVIVDNGGPGTSSTGLWNASASAGSYGSGSVWSKYSGSKDPPSYTFGATLPPGRYDVYEWHSVWPTRTRAAPYVIAHADGEQTVVVDQSTAGGQWNHLGGFLFDGVARVTVQATDREKSTNADAIRFVCRSP